MHREHYTPEPVNSGEPSTLALFLGAAAALLTLWVLIVFFFSL